MLGPSTPLVLSAMIELVENTAVSPWLINRPRLGGRVLGDRRVACGELAAPAFEVVVERGDGPSVPSVVAAEGRVRDQGAAAVRGDPAASGAGCRVAGDRRVGHEKGVGQRGEDASAAVRRPCRRRRCRCRRSSCRLMWTVLAYLVEIAPPPSASLLEITEESTRRDAVLGCDRAARLVERHVAGDHRVLDHQVGGDGVDRAAVLALAGVAAGQRQPRDRHLVEAGRRTPRRVDAEEAVALVAVHGHARVARADDLDALVDLEVAIRQRERAGQA